MGILANLFKGNSFQYEPKAEEEAEVLIREAIVTTKDFENNFLVWLEKGMHKGLLDYLNECISERKENSGAEVNVYFHESKNSNGFYFRAESPWLTEDYHFLVRLIKKKLVAQHYVQNHATREVIEQKGVLKTKEEFFFKPSLKFKRETPYQQLFGNVFVEHRINEDKTDLIKIMVNTYTDQLYKKPYDFQDFLTEICLI
ncbi:hypothetical protein N8371_09200 [Vicingaceae bacterium]|nr:hypothetical protein [Vicingaceae bacterium]MDB4062068.1 hypothetical protein [Vicingaceae bacterium]MDC0004923.1 hypothetical protein [bacterium]MDC1452563.1 hypothetical protein [Vicingaceae bacterium]